MSKWLPIEQTPYLTPHEEDVDGVAVRVSPSPIDLPVAVRTYIKTNGSPVVDFAYLANAEEKKVCKLQDVRLHLGAESGRIWAIELDPGLLLSQSTHEQILQIIFRAVDRLIESSSRNRHRQQPNHQVTKEVLKKSRVLDTLQFPAVSVVANIRLNGSSR